MKTLSFVGRFLRVTGPLVVLGTLLGAVTPSYAEEPQPHIWAMAADNSIYVGNFTPNASLNLKVYDGEEVVLGPLALQTDEGGHGKWQDEDLFNLLVGHRIVVQDTVGGITKELTLVWVTFDLLDIDTDIARGTAPPAEAVYMGVGFPDGPGTGFNTVADATGHWEVDLGAAGYDVLPFMKGGVHVYDEDRDHTCDELPRATYWEDSTVSTQSFTPNESVTVELFEAEGGVLLYGPETRSVDEDGRLTSWLNLTDLGIEPIPGNFLVVTDDVSGHSKTIAIQDFVMDPIDYVDDLVSGTALPNAPLRVFADTPTGNYALDTAADPSGRWIADFGAIGADLAWPTGISAQSRDEDLDIIVVPQGPEPRIHASPTTNAIDVDEFPPDTSVLVTVYDGEGGSTVLGPIQLQTDEDGSAHASWWRGMEGEFFDLLVGHQIIVSDGAGTTKELTVIQHTFDLLDHVNDSAVGTAPPGATVRVYVGQERGDISVYLSADADQNGEWVLDLGAEGFDVLPFMKGDAHVYDEDGDMTSDSPPEIQYWGADEISTQGFTPNASVTVALYDGPEGDLLIGPETHSLNADGVVVAPMNFTERPHHPTPGDYLVVTDDVSSYWKAVVVPDYEYDPVDYMNDTISGGAPPNAPMRLHVDTQSGHFSIDTVADEYGRWTEDLGALGADLHWETSVSAHSFDEDLDLIRVPRRDTFAASITWDWILYGFKDYDSPGTVTFKIYESAGGPLLTSYTAVDELIVEPGVDLKPGVYIVATDDQTGKRKELVLVDAAVTLVDRDADLIEGTAPPFSTVEVELTWLPFWIYDKTRVTADEQGQWSADFSAHGFDITDEMNAQARVVDEDFDASVAQDPPSPWIEASLTGDWVHFRDVGHFAEIEIEVFDAEGASVFGPETGSTQMERDVSFDVWEEGVDLVPGSHILIANVVTGDSRDLVLVPLAVDNVDWEQDTVEGSAEPNAAVEVEAFIPWEDSVQVGAIADVDGYWTADFGTAGHDLTQDMNVMARVRDDDGDATQAEPVPPPPPPRISASLPRDEVLAQFFPPGSPATFVVRDASGNLVGDAQARVTDADGSAMLYLAELGIDLVPGMVVEATCDTIVKALTLSTVAITRLDPETDQLEGVATGCTFTGVWAGSDAAGRFLIVDVDEDGLWLADFAGQGFDVTDEMRGWLGCWDEDNDPTTTETIDPVAAFEVGPLVEGTPAVFTDTSADLNGDIIAWAWDFGDEATSDEQSPIHTFVESGFYDVSLTITDQTGLSHTAIQAVTVYNVALGGISAPADPIEEGTLVEVSAEFSDPGELDTHWAKWYWGDGNTCSSSTADDLECWLTEDSGEGTVGGEHIYRSPGVYTVRVEVWDEDGDYSESIFEYVVVYDPEGGFVTGGGWIDSPEGACRLTDACEGATGKASFGFVSKYKKGASVPTGQTQFQFKAGDLNFHSERYDWLVIAGARARYKGVGTISGEGEYKFMLTALDAHINESDSHEADRFRIKMWTEDEDGNETIVYDNALGASDDFDDETLEETTTELGGGSIVIHKK